MCFSLTERMQEFVKVLAVVCENILGIRFLGIGLTLNNMFSGEINQALCCLL